VPLVAPDTSLRLGLLAAAVVLTAALATPTTASPPPPVSAHAFFVVSAVDNSTLAARSPAAKRAVASITKLMTVLVALEHVSPDEMVVVPRQATGIGEATAGLRPGDRVTVRDLVVGVLVPSANDAATALALFVAHGSLPRFVALMNAKARLLGMRDTHFANPHGLDQAGHHSSARDTVTLLRAALRKPLVREWSRRRAATLSTGRMVVSTDDLLGRVPQLVGGKTGHTDDAGWSQVAGARENGATVYAALLGAPTREARNKDLEGLLRWALAQYRPARVIDTERTYAIVSTGWGRPSVRLVARWTLVRPTSVNRPLVERVVAPVVVALPVARGQRLGQVRVYDGRRLVGRAALVADRAVSQPGLGGKTGFVLRRAVHHLWGMVDP
jgi:serine-type D-Ala-D-Ala carboxypeptidase (penicillin-binding protein 5/6)